MLEVLQSSLVTNIFETECREKISHQKGFVLKRENWHITSLNLRDVNSRTRVTHT